MNLRKFVVAAALGATVLTAVPALVAPQEAAAACWGDALSDCTPDDGGGGSGGDPSGGDDPSGGGIPQVIISGTAGAVDVSGGTIGAPVSTDLPQVIISGTADPLYYYPADPHIPSSWVQATGGGGGGAAPGAVVYSVGKKEIKKTDCLRNNSSVPTKFSRNVSYQVVYEVSANISADGMKMLSASLGTKLNVQISEQTGVEVTLNPGQGWQLQVEYQTVVYKIVTPNTFSSGYTAEYVNVYQPTQNVTAVNC